MSVITKTISEDVIARARVLKEQGFTRKQIASTLHVSYRIIQSIFGTERLGIDRSNKQPWTVEGLQKLKEVYKDTPIKELCLMFNRDRGELRQLLFHLGWDIPTSFFRKNKEEIAKKIIELSPKYNQWEIARLLKVSRPYIQSVCKEYQIKCQKKKGNLKITKTLNSAYKEQADAIKEKLKTQFTEGTNGKT